MSRKTDGEVGSLPAGSAACIPAHEYGGLTPRFDNSQKLAYDTSYVVRCFIVHPYECLMDAIISTPLSQGSKDSMSKRSKILILTSKTGGGHVTLAEIFRDLLECDYEVEIIDPLPTFVHQHYSFVSRHALWLWEAEFRFWDTPRKSLIMHQGITKIFARSFNSMLDDVQPSVIITTHPFLTYGIMRVIEKEHPHIPFVMLLTELTHLHASSLTERKATINLAPTDEVYTQALDAGFPPDRLYIIGWPVRSQFYQTDPSTRTRILTQLHLDPERFTIFLQGGGKGAARFEHAVENILTACSDAQIILAAGTNQTLLTRFQGMNNVYALPFTNEIAPFMAAADVIMGKAGPNALFESVALGKPFIASSYIHGQEEANLEFIRHHDLGWVVLKPEEQRDLITVLISTPSQLHAKVVKIEAYRQSNTAANSSIAPLIRALVP
jgi:UDP-N-acetylglucosamine:LPS N-acetylglucosamine transferase